jgi:hypothetical protein
VRAPRQRARTALGTLARCPYRPRPSLSHARLQARPAVASARWLDRRGMRCAARRRAVEWAWMLGRAARQRTGGAVGAGCEGAGRMGVSRARDAACITWEWVEHARVVLVLSEFDGRPRAREVQRLEMREVLRHRTGGVHLHGPPAGLSAHTRHRTNVQPLKANAVRVHVHGRVRDGDGIGRASASWMTWPDSREHVRPQTGNERRPSHSSAA